MTERLPTLLHDLAEQAPTPPSAAGIWQRASRVRRRRRLGMLTVAAVSAVAAVIAGSQALIVVSRTPAEEPGGYRLAPLPPELDEPIGGVPTLNERPTDRVLMTVQATMFDRRFLQKRAMLRCDESGACTDRVGQFAVGADHAYRFVNDRQDQDLGVFVSPDGQYVAYSEAGLPLVEAQQPTGSWGIVHASGDRMGPLFECTGSAGWTWDGRFACITHDEPVATIRLLRPTRDGVPEVEEIHWFVPDSDTAPITWSLLPQTIGQDITGARGPVVLGSLAERPDVVALIDRTGDVVRGVDYPGRTPVHPLRWCGPDSVLVWAEGGIGFSVLDLDGNVRSRFDAEASWNALGCRPDGSIALEEGGIGADALGNVHLIAPDGTRVGTVQGPVMPPGGSYVWMPRVGSIAVNAIAWTVDGAPAHVAGTSLLEWLDEALLVCALAAALALPLFVFAWWRRTSRSRNGTSRPGSDA